MKKTAITTDHIAAAERVAGVTYTDAERLLMVDSLDGQVETEIGRRALALPNDLPRACRFDPRLPGWLPPDPGSFREPAPKGKALPHSDVDIAFASVAELSEWVRNGNLTSRRLTEIYLHRIREFDPSISAIVTITEDLARKQAEDADALLRSGTYLGPLHGIPYGLKDIFDTAGISTTWGAEPYRDRVPHSDARVTTLLREAGAVLIAKTSVGALAYGDRWLGNQTRNPWNLCEGSSGSSAGSAAGVAAGLFAFAIGTETLGSITSPCHRCGTTGLRPTFGRVSRKGAMTLSWSMDKVGPICRTVEDTALVLRAINGGDRDDPCSIDAPLGFDAESEIGGMKIGFDPAWFSDELTLDTDTAALNTLSDLEAELVEIRLPDLPYDGFLSVLYAEAAAAFEELTQTNRDDELSEQAHSAWPNIFRRSRFLTAVDHIQWDRLRYQLMTIMDATFQKVDAIISPLMVGPMLTISNLTGHPSLILPAGFGQSRVREDPSIANGRLEAEREDPDGPRHTVPHGIVLYSALFDERLLFRLGMALESRFDVHRHRPPLFDATEKAIAS